MSIEKRINAILATREATWQENAKHYVECPHPFKSAIRRLSDGMQDWLRDQLTATGETIEAAQLCEALVEFGLKEFDWDDAADKYVCLVPDPDNE